MNRSATETDDAALSQPPASGAWFPDMPIAERRFLDLSPERPFALEGGGLLVQPEVVFETWGTLDASAGNALLVCHALTGDAHAHGDAMPGQPSEGWWNDFIGPGRPLDTDRFFIVCANVLGGCQGTTGPASIDPETGRHYAANFPVVTIRDVVRSQRALAAHLGIEQWLAVVGGSMGGMQALEWAVTYPDRLRGLVIIASTAAASTQQIAWSQVGRQAILDDPGWRGGDFYGLEPGEGPHRGLSNARRIAMIHYRSDEEFERRFGRNSNMAGDPFSLDHQFDVESYLDYQGNKIQWRFDANTYLVLNKMMDLHDLGRGRGGVEKALTRVRVPTQVMSVRTDFLYPRHQQMRMVDGLTGRVPVEHIDIDSDNGHDGFLTEPDQTGPPMGEFVERIAKN